MTVSNVSSTHNPDVSDDFRLPVRGSIKTHLLVRHGSAIPEIAGGGASVEERTEAMYECLGYFTELWHARSDGQSDSMDFITALSNHPDTNDMVDRPLEYPTSYCSLLAVTTPRETVPGWCLGPQRNRDQFDKLKADHGLIKSLVPEIIRWQTHSCICAHRNTRCRTGRKTNQERRQGSHVVCLGQPRRIGH